MPTENASEREVVTIVRVVDGDTVIVKLKNDMQLRLRLVGIDAPELSQPHGNSARDALQKLLQQASAVYIEKQGLDVFGRTLAKLFYEGSGTPGDVQLYMLRNGHAWHYKRFDSNPKYAAAEGMARKKRIGLWSVENPQPPWSYRGAKKGKRQQQPTPNYIKRMLPECDGCCNDAFFVCSGCKKVFYCGEQCADQRWPLHEWECSTVSVCTIEAKEDDETMCFSDEESCLSIPKTRKLKPEEYILPSIDLAILSKSLETKTATLSSIFERNLERILRIQLVVYHRLQAAQHAIMDQFHEDFEAEIGKSWQEAAPAERDSRLEEFQAKMKLVNVFDSTIADILDALGGSPEGVLSAYEIGASEREAFPPAPKPRPRRLRRLSDTAAPSLKSLMVLLPGEVIDGRGDSLRQQLEESMKNIESFVNGISSEAGEERRIRTRIALSNLLKSISNSIGQEGIKNLIAARVLQIIYRPRSVYTGHLNIALMGPPGTGKTELAQQIVSLYQLTGILPRKTDAIINRKVGRPSLVSGYQGATAIKTKSWLINNIGSVGFIDEAYELVHPPFDTFGQEALNTIVNVLDGYKGQTAIIAAGYRDEMEKQFFGENPGMIRRFPDRWIFKPFTANELFQIMRQKVGTQGYRLSDDAEKISEQLIGVLHDGGFFINTNAGGITNIIDFAIRSHTVQIFAVKDVSEDSNELNALSIRAAFATFVKSLTGKDIIYYRAPQKGQAGPVIQFVSERQKKKGFKQSTEELARRTTASVSLPRT